MGAVIVALMAAMAWVQWRQSALVSQAMLSSGDNLAHFLYQADNEYLRLRERWPSASVQTAGAAPDLASLQLRYDIFVSRIDVLRNASQRLQIGAAGDIRAAVSQAQAFISRADEVLGAGPASAADVPRLRALRAELEALDPALRSLSAGAAELVALNATRVSDVASAHNRLGIALSIFLAMFAVVFAAFALQQLRRQHQRGRELEALSEQLGKARRAAEAASQAKSAFLANMSHEIRTPFQGLHGMLHLLAGTGLNPTQAGYLRTASASASHLLAILNDVLDMSRLESGRMTLAARPARLHEVLREIEGLMRPQAEAKGLHFVLDVEEAVPDAVRIDATRVRQVLFNLVANAIKFSERGQVTVRATAEPVAQADPPRSQVVVEVIDTGIGMDAATLGRLFQRFSQGDDTRSRRFGGTGLGLEISRSLARLMGGDITVTSRLGEGSVFTLSLPVEIDAQAQGSGPAHDAAVLKAVAADTSLRRLKVLVADDNEVNRLVLDAILTGMGHDVTFAVDGSDALQQAGASRWDAVLMDLHMPVMDGFEAARGIRELDDPVRAGVPIVALTADVVAETRERCLQAGIQDFLTKPVDTTELAACLQRVARGAATAAA